MFAQARLLTVHKESGVWAGATSFYEGLNRFKIGCYTALSLKGIGLRILWKNDTYARVQGTIIDVRCVESADLYSIKSFEKIIK